MKIDTRQVHAYLNHLAALGQLTKDTKTTTVETTFLKLRRLEAKGHRLAERLCNGDESAQGEFDQLEGKVLRLLPGLSANDLIINGDPRGFTLKISDVKAAALKMNQTDWGRFGILAPSFT